MAELEIGRAVVEVLPTSHLVSRCRERLGDLSPKFKRGHPTRLWGVLVKPIRRKPSDCLYLDVDGIGRFVIAQTGQRCVGITFIPQIFCHDPALPTCELSTDRACHLYRQRGSS